MGLIDYKKLPKCRVSNLSVVKVHSQGQGVFGVQNLDVRHILHAAHFPGDHGVSNLLSL